MPCHQWDRSAPSFQWLDDERFVIARSAITCEAEGKKRIITGFAVMDAKGAEQAKSWRDDRRYLSLSQGNIIAALGANKIEFFDSELRVKGSAVCLNELSSCEITWAPEATLPSDFALCSESFASGQSCKFYKGLPPEEVASTKLRPLLTGLRDEDPYTHVKKQRSQTIWRVSPTETWTFLRDDVLTRSKANGTSSPVFEGVLAQEYGTVARVRCPLAEGVSS